MVEKAYFDYLFFCDEGCFGYLVFVMSLRDIGVTFGCISKRYIIFMVL
jgi:hypothetical protein